MADVTHAVEAFEVAFEAGDATDFQRALDELSAVTACLNERLDPPLVARYFRAMGLDSYATGRTDTSARWWAAARRLDPNAPLPVYPAGHHATHLYWARDPDAVTLVQLQIPIGSPFVIDGSYTREFPLELPTIVQRAKGDAYDFQVLPGGVLPTYRRRRPLRIGLLGVSGASVIGCLASLALASAVKTEFKTGDASFSELVVLQQRANSASALSLGLGAVAIGTGTAAVLTKR